jgi:ABC-type multidrug transport system ATPase subunit
LVGPNGSGKSTLIRIVMGMLRYEGSVRVDGRCPFRERSGLMARMAYVPQVAPRLAVTVQEIGRAVAELRGIDPREIHAAARELALDLDAVARQELRNLSGGMRQKLLIAHALAARASLLVLDEPTASLDPASRDAFFRLVEQLEPRPTILLCSHRLEEIRRIVDRVAVLDEGRIVHAGDVAGFVRRARRAVLEVRVQDGAAATWLSERGFRAGSQGWWSRPVEDGERVALLGSLTRELGPRIDDLLVRDAELVDPQEEIGCNR